MSTHDIITTLENLIRTCRDGEAGFHVAMEAVEDEHLKHLLASCSQQRGSFADDLEQLLEIYTAREPGRDTSVAGAIHRGWINVRAAVQHGDRAAILAECERGEDAAVRNYEQALEQEMPPNLRSVIESQYRCVLETHDQIRDLRDTARAMS